MLDKDQNAQKPPGLHRKGLDRADGNLDPHKGAGRWKSFEGVPHTRSLQGRGGREGRSGAHVGLKQIWPKVIDRLPSLR